MKILFLAHRLPYPPDRGDRIRSWHVLKALARKFDLHLGCFAESGDELQHLPVIDKLVASRCVPLRRKPLPLAGLQAIAESRSVSETAFDSGTLRHWGQETVRRERIDAIYVFSGQMGQFVPDDFRGRLLADLVDVDSAKFEAYAAEKPGPRGWIDRREGRLLRAMEATMVARADHTFLVSEAEAELLRSRCDGGPISALRNGIDTDEFDPDAVSAEDVFTGEGPHCVFTGQMDYRPNVDAVVRFARHALPAIQREFPSARFHVVGRNPAPQVLALSDQGGCEVHGSVPDMRPYLAAADVVVAPLSLARGVQNKVLEAMAMARPVVLTPEAATGIGASDGLHFRVSSSHDAFAQDVIECVRNPADSARMGSAARQFVKDTLGWEAVLAGLPALVRGYPRTHQDTRDAA